MDEYAPLVFVNSADARAAQMFTLAHELAHLWLGRGGVFNLRQLQPGEDEVELFCNRVAAEFLVPAEALRAAWKDIKPSRTPVQAFARRFKVSPLVAARRALDLGLMSKTRFFAFYSEYVEEAKRAEERKKSAGKSKGDFWATQGVRIGRRFGEAVIRAAKEGRLLYRDAYHLTGLSGRTFDEFVGRLEAEGR